MTLVERMILPDWPGSTLLLSLITEGDNMPRKKLELKISSSERKELENIINNDNSSKKMVLRCKIILMTDQGVPLKEIAGILGLSKVTVNTWRQIYLAKGMEGLKVKKRLGRPSKIAKDILSSHFPELPDDVSLPLRKALNMRSKIAYLLHKIETMCGA